MAPAKSFTPKQGQYLAFIYAYTRLHRRPPAEERSMKHYAGLDVSVKETSICIVDEAGRICREMKVVSHPEDLLAVLCDPAWRLERVGLEAGPLSQWLFSGSAISFMKSRNSMRRRRRLWAVMTLPVATSSAANRVEVPCRL